MATRLLRRAGCLDLVMLLASLLSTVPYGVQPASAQPSFQGLGDLPGGPYESQPYGVSADGSVVVGWSLAEYPPWTWQAFRWTAAEGMQALGDLPGGQSRSGANAVSADGSVIVGYGTVGSSPGDNILEAFRWTAANGMQSIPNLLTSGVQSCWAR